MDTVTMSIDGKTITAQKGKTVLQAAIENGLSVPYYCYHPGLGIDGSCRVCIVKIEKMPKLQTSCSTPVAEGMVVSTRTPDVIEARAGVFEFLLINHPLDCPVCDKGGECPLQDFSYSFGPAQSRMEFPRRVFDGEGVRADVDFGPRLLLNRNRCILCTRCVRFMREIDDDAQISIVDRGYGSEIATFQEQGVHSLLSGNLMDVCPVGAITTRDYRFKSRPWDNPQAVDTICTLCSKGCNVTAWIKAKPEWAKGARLVRFTPRFEPEVNGYWMCDIGRFEYHWVEGENRLRRPLIRRDGGLQEPQSWHDALTWLRDKLAEVEAAGQPLTFLISAHAAHEEIFLIRRLAAATGNAPVAVSWRYAPKKQPAGTRFRIPAADAPNINGARDLGLQVGAGNDGPPDLAALRDSTMSGSVYALYVLDPGPEGSIGNVSWIVEARAAGKLPVLIVQGVMKTPLTDAADLVLPGASYVEKEASYTNERGRVQAAARVNAPPGDAMEDWQILVNVGRTIGLAWTYTESTQIRTAIAAEIGGTPGYANLDAMTFAHPVEARNWLQTSNPSERWKWDFVFQDVPPLKFAPEPEPMARPDIIPLTKVE
jgi:NADH-quinone oxidoreductase subunit G